MLTLTAQQTRQLYNSLKFLAVSKSRTQTTANTSKLNMLTQVLTTMYSVTATVQTAQSKHGHLKQHQAEETMLTLLKLYGACKDTAMAQKTSNQATSQSTHGTTKLALIHLQSQQTHTKANTLSSQHAKTLTTASQQSKSQLTFHSTAL